MPCTKGMRACKASCLHRELVQTYRLARHAAELACELVCMGYETEHKESCKLPVFKDFLIHGYEERPEDFETVTQSLPKVS